MTLFGSILPSVPASFNVLPFDVFVLPLRLMMARRTTQLRPRESLCLFTLDEILLALASTLIIVGIKPEIKQGMNHWARSDGRTGSVEGLRSCFHSIVSVFVGARGCVWVYEQVSWKVWLRNEKPKNHPKSWSFCFGLTMWPWWRCGVVNSITFHFGLSIKCKACRCVKVANARKESGHESERRGRTRKSIKSRPCCKWNFPWNFRLWAPSKRKLYENLWQLYFRKNTFRLRPLKSRQSAWKHFAHGRSLIRNDPRPRMYSNLFAFIEDRWAHRHRTLFAFIGLVWMPLDVPALRMTSNANESKACRGEWKIYGRKILYIGMQQYKQHRLCEFRFWAFDNVKEQWQKENIRFSRITRMSGKLVGDGAWSVACAWMRMIHSDRVEWAHSGKVEIEFSLNWWTSRGECNGYLFDTTAICHSIVVSALGAVNHEKR